ncbi:MAG: hypothetical protein WA828_16720 [Coleofasciculaceae cyanobacterium]
MTIAYQTRKRKQNENLLVISSLILALILCVAVVWLGYTKFQGIETNTGGDYPTFPLNSTGQLIQIFIGTLYFVVNLLYIIWLFQPQRRYFYQPINFSTLLRLSFPFLLLGFIAYPLGNDIYLYLHYGSMGLNGLNPFIHRAGSFRSEFYEFLRWRQSSTYGPVSLIFFATSAAVAPFSKLLAIYLFKGFCLAAHLLNGYLVFRLLKKDAYTEKVTLAYLCNPLILFEQVGSAHVDVFVCTTFLLLIFCFKYKAYFLGILTIWLGFMAKTLPILWLPLIGAFLIQQRRWLSLLLMVMTSLAIIGLLTVTVLPTPESWQSLLNPGVESHTAASIHRIFFTYLGYLPSLSTKLKLDILSKFKLVTLALFGLYYFVTLVQISLQRRYSVTNLGLEIGWVSLILMLLATPWLMPWYASILLPIAVLNLDERKFVFASLAFCLSSTAYYMLLSTGVFQSWFIVGLPCLALGVNMFLPKSKRYLV